MDHEQFFREHGQKYVDLHEFNAGTPVTVEDLYAAFEARLASRLKAVTPELLRPAELSIVGDRCYALRKMLDDSLGHPKPQIDASGAAG